MHFDVQYDIEDPVSVRSAVKDMVEYVGFRPSMMLAQAVRNGLSVDQLAIYAGLAGVQGFPVRAFHEHFALNDVEDNTLERVV